MTRLKDIVSHCAGWLSSAGRSRATRTAAHHRPLRLEPLEDRTVPAPAVLDPNLGVRQVVGGLVTPTSMAFIGDNDFFVLEKTSGQVKRVINGVLAGPVLDLPVNNSSERGLLGIALSPHFATDHFVYLYWTQSSTNADSSNLADVPLLATGWTGSSGTVRR